MILNCPKCGKQIDNASINIAQDAAFCAPCGAIHKVSELVATAQAATGFVSVGAAALICTKCRTQLREDAQFCDKCGAPVGAAEPAPPALKAEFSHSGDQMYTCELFSDENHVGTIPNVKNEYFSDTRKWLETIYPGIEVVKKE